MTPDKMSNRRNDSIVEKMLVDEMSLDAMTADKMSAN